MTKMEAPFELLLSQLDPPATAVIADIEVRWGVGVGFGGIFRWPCCGLCQPPSCQCCTVSIFSHNTRTSHLNVLILETKFQGFLHLI
ncbi:hypothetical protein ACFXTN_005743 [Malus domestica]